MAFYTLPTFTDNSSKKHVTVEMVGIMLQHLEDKRFPHTELELEFALVTKREMTEERHNLTLQIS